jgi:hypothetical protein
MKYGLLLIEWIPHGMAGEAAEDRHRPELPKLNGEDNLAGM